MSENVSAFQHGMRPELARRIVASFEKRFERAHLYMAYQAAFPLALTPDLLYRLWAHFPYTIYGEPLKIPWVAVADLLLSDLCNEVGYELYEMDKAVRTELLRALQADPNFGAQRISELSDFLLAYVQQRFDGPDPDTQDIANAQKWTVLAYTQSQEAARELALALRTSLEQGDRTEQLRLASLIETFADPLQGYTPLLTYARGISYLARGWMEDATIQFDSIAGEEQAIAVEGVHLPIPQRSEVSPVTQQKKERSNLKPKTRKKPDDANKPRSKPPGVRPLPPPTGSAPYHLSLGSILPPGQMEIIHSSGRLVFHVAGNTGGVKAPEPQQIVASKMQEDFNISDPAARPSFFYNLGEVIYYYGETEQYYSQFYVPYQLYPAPIFAIPGNHDGDVSEVSDEKKISLEGFVRNFCATERRPTREAGDTGRAAMIQPNVYWTLETPFATLIGLYTNVPEGGVLDENQRAWLEAELMYAPGDKALIVATHHPPYSADTFHSGSAYMKEVLDQAIEKAGRMPDAIFSSHVNNYQRFTRLISGREVPYIIAGAGGYWHLHTMQKNQAGQSLETPYSFPGTDVTLEAYCADRHGYLRVEITPQALKGEYYTVPRTSEDLKGPAELRDTFVLDLGTHRLQKPEPASSSQQDLTSLPLTHANLTPRELEVLRLLTQGLTNAQIAERLAISSSTVAAHVSRIFNKLGSNSRSAVVRYAIEHSLV